MGAILSACESHRARFEAHQAHMQRCFAGLRVLHWLGPLACLGTVGSVFWGLGGWFTAGVALQIAVAAAHYWLGAHVDFTQAQIRAELLAEVEDLERRLLERMPPYGEA